MTDDERKKIGLMMSSKIQPLSITENKHGLLLHTIRDDKPYPLASVTRNEFNRMTVHEILEYTKVGVNENAGKG